MSEKPIITLDNETNTGMNSSNGQLGNEQLGRVICRHSTEYEVEALDGISKGKVFRCVGRRKLNSIVTGDLVRWRAERSLRGVIESCSERRNLLQRPDNFGRIKAVAANIDQMIVVVACKPTPQPNLIDRYIVAAEQLRVNALIVLNKADLINNDNRRDLESLLSSYEQLGYETLSIDQSTAAMALNSHLIDQTSIMVGQSGVGKSTLINALLPGADLAVGRLSKTSGEGMHTTTRASLFHFDFGGSIIDSPGIRDFSLWHMTAGELQQGYVEIARAARSCKFRDCQHTAEPKCAVRASVEGGEISTQRWQSFVETRNSMQQQQLRGFSS